MSRSAYATNKPNINVTPLIDVLLVVLIIFMVAAPLRPASFKAQLPAQRDPDPRFRLNDRTLVVTIEADRSLKLNALTEMGTVDDPSKLSARLSSLFAERTVNRAYRDDMVSRFDVPEAERIEKTVFIKAPRFIAYGEVTKVIDALKGAGANPVGLQLDDLN
ncbi:MAG TPA: biopolymer transporter ExbD [Pyrinomonadaceae bacterium]|nr:biopolymer transporter ExbD [Pyrinomonadaceae bacterium]